MMMMTMHVAPARTAMLLLAASAAALAAGCGGGTKTVSVASSPPASSSNATGAGATAQTGASTPSTTGTAGSGATGPGGSSGSSSGGTPATGTGTRSATAPAFTETGKGGASAAGLPAAEAVVRAHGYTAGDTSDYHANQTLRVLVGTGSRSNDGYDKQAFFFVNGRYIGTDASRPSAQIGVVAQSDTEVTLAYSLYRPNDPLCCPGGGTAHVRFQLNNGHLVPLDPIPPASSSTGTSRQ